MGRIFISAGHGGKEGGVLDPGSIAGGTTEAQQMILLRDQVVRELRSRGLEVLSVPDDQSFQGTLQWINSRAQPGDVALEIHADAYENPNVRGAIVFYIANNTERKQNAELILLSYLRRIPQMPRQGEGVKPDTATGVGKLAFCRQIRIPSLLMEVGFLTNPDDRALILNRRQEMALGIADGLEAWSRGLTSPVSEPVYPIINIRINDKNYEEEGILVNNNSYIPIDLADRLGVDLTEDPTIRLIQYRGVVYVKAIELRDSNISVGWENSTRTVILRSILKICPGDFERIMSHGNTSEVQLIMFLKDNNEDALSQFPDIPKLYREEAAIEGVNYDIAFCQMCFATNFLSFGGEIKPSQNNFADLGSVSGGPQGATFPSAKIGVRAQIQHLKAYASTEPLVQEVVDPRFRFVKRGIAPLVKQLGGRWTADLDYGDKILAIVRRLYESAGLF